MTQNRPELWRDHLPQPKPDGNKYDRGVALIYGGAEMTGAARLAARAAQRIGAGLVHIATPKAAVPIYAQSLESVIIHEADCLSAWHNLTTNDKCTAILIGPGLPLGDEPKELVYDALAAQKSCVLDAGALTNFANDPVDLFNTLHDQCVITPHEGEFQKLFGAHIDENADKVARAKQAAKITEAVVLLKGSKTVIAAPGGQYVVNTNAPPWLATAGAGDVLAGIILGLLAQKMPVFEATAAAAWLHGEVANDFGEGLIAEDLVTGIPEALQMLLLPRVYKDNVT